MRLRKGKLISDYLEEYPKLPKHLYLWSLEYNHADLEESQNFLRISSMGEKNTRLAQKRKYDMIPFPVGLEDANTRNSCRNVV